MKKVSFRVRNFDKEQFLTHNIDNEATLDEEVLDFLEDEEPKGIVPIIFEEEEEFDTFSYNVTDKIRLCELSDQEINAEMVLRVMRGLVLALIDMGEYRVPLSYLVLHRNYIYINSDYEVEFICVPLENMQEDVDLNVFLRNFVASLRFDSSENGDYVARLLSYINNTAIFSLRNMITLIEDLMDAMGVELPEDSSTDIYVDYQEVLNDDDDDEEAISIGGDTYTPVKDSMDEPELAAVEPEEENAPVAEGVEDDSVENEVVDGQAVEDVEAATEELKEDTEVVDEQVAETVAEEVEAVVEESEEDVETTAEEPAEADAEETVEAAATLDEEIVGEESAKATEISDEKSAEPVESVAKDSADMAEAQSIVADMKKMVKEKKVVEVEETLKKPSKKPSFKTKDTSLTGVVIDDDFDAFLAEKEREENEVKHEESGLKIKKNIKVNRASVVKSNQEEPKDEVTEEPKDEEVVSNSILSQSVGMTGILKGSDIPKANPYLIRVNTEERIMITKQNFKIGKANMGVDYTVKGNSAVSRIHAVIISKDDVYYVKDNKSTNHTFVNGKILEEGENELLTHDCKIVLGDEEFVFKLR